MKRLLTVLLPSLLGLLLAACATNKVDWNSRVGSYNFDQAVLEMGPPDKVAQLTDGTRVAEWMTSRGYTQGGFLVHSGPFLHTYADAPSPDYFLRLTFTADGRLQSWKKYAR
ncbi:MAG TPA: hypothetical protein VEH27_06505 [Methylomirabilota bacterium]|nr:hypothetical protein [Methylomirabilota bacterium]